MAGRSLPIAPAVLERIKFPRADDLACELYDLLDAVFGPSDPEAREVWRLLDEEELSRKEMRSFFRQAAEAENPLEFVSGDTTARARLNAHMRVRWSTREARRAGHPSSLAGASWASLSDSARLMVREGLLHLAAYEATQVRAGQPPKDRTDTALEGLAEIYARHALFGGSHWELPHSERSRFIQFAVRMLQGHLHRTELEPGAIAKRWKRLKAAQRKGQDHL